MKRGKNQKVIIIFKAQKKWHWALSASLFHFVRADNQIILAPISGESWKRHKNVFVFLEFLGQFSTKEPEIALVSIPLDEMPVTKLARGFPFAL